MDDDNDSSNKNKSNLPIECQGDVSSLYHPHGPWTGISWDSNSSDCRSVERLGIHCSLFTLFTMLLKRYHLVTLVGFEFGTAFCCGRYLMRHVKYFMRSMRLNAYRPGAKDSCLCQRRIRTDRTSPVGHMLSKDVSCCLFERRHI